MDGGFSHCRDESPHLAREHLVRIFSNNMYFYGSI